MESFIAFCIFVVLFWPKDQSAKIKALEERLTKLEEEVESLKNTTGQSSS